MARLTAADLSGNWSVKGIQWKELYKGNIITGKMHEVLYGCLAKLKDYEDTGLDPEQVQQLKESIPSQIPLERAEYAHEASYIAGWNDCVRKITEKVE